MYIIKTKGKAKIPNYVQIRDENFVLIFYFRVDRPLPNIINRLNLNYTESEFKNIIDNLSFGKIEDLKSLTPAGKHGA